MATVLHPRASRAATRGPESNCQSDPPETRRQGARTAPAIRKELPQMRARMGSSIAVVAAVIGLAAGVAGPVYSAFGGHTSSTGTSVHAGRIMGAVKADK